MADLEDPDLIYSCFICADTLSDIRQASGQSSTTQDGRSHAVEGDNQLWLMSCWHVVCSRHFDARGASLSVSSMSSAHTVGTDVQEPDANGRSRAACPYCVQHRNDPAIRTLYGIRGFQRGEYDQEIPDVYFRVPEEAFNSSLESEALKVIEYPHDRAPRLANVCSFNILHL